MQPNLFSDMSSKEGDGLVLALELVATTMVMLGLGFLLDRWIGTTPVFTVVLGAFTLAYEVWKITSGYGAAMAEHEARRNPLRQGPR